MQEATSFRTTGTLVLLLLAAALASPLIAQNSPGTAPPEPGIVQKLAEKLQGRWTLDARNVVTGQAQQAATARQLTIYDMRSISATQATGKLMILESGTLEAFVETPSLFVEDPSLAGKGYSLGGLWDVTINQVSDPRCVDGVAAAMSYVGELEGSYGIFKYGCVADTNTTGIFCLVGSNQFEMVGVAQTETGVEGVRDTWTGFTVGNDGTTDYLTHELPREGSQTSVLQDDYSKLDVETRIHGQSVEGYWTELIENKTLIMGQLDVGQLLASL